MREKKRVEGRSVQQLQTRMYDEERVFVSFFLSIMIGVPC